MHCVLVLQTKLLKTCANVEVPSHLEVEAEHCTSKEPEVFQGLSLVVLNHRLQIDFVQHLPEVPVPLSG